MDQEELRAHKAGYQRTYYHKHLESQREANNRRNKAYYARHIADPEWRAAYYAKAAARRAAIHQWLDEYKAALGCVDCGYNAHPVALEFDHVAAGKEIDMSNVRTWPQAKREVARCVVRCANCHAIRHYEEMKTKKEPSCYYD